MAEAKDRPVRAAVTGWRGRLGSELVRRGCIPLKCDVTDPKWISAALEAVKPDVVIHCAAMTDVDECERRPGLATEVNALGTWHLCRAFAGPIVYLSTDYIFDGRHGPYDENALPNPLGMYGWSKLGGEVAVRMHPGARDLIVRTTVLFDRWSENFVTKVAYALLRGQRLTLPGDMLGSPTYAPDLARGILEAIDQGMTGVLNLVGSRIMSRLDMGQFMADKLDLSGWVEAGPPIGAANRPLRAGLVIDKACALNIHIGDPLYGMQEVVAYALETMGARRPDHR